ncbi:collagen alpha-1(III) chain-like, partial [Peromyscus leucopus]|uniref:collagen alpha-1(III) chain-like n=1 Tax=Peromyscus leucopus TaxID=10041 RepID=UPI001884EFEB
RSERTSSREDVSVRGASPPSGHQSPDTSDIRLWVCGERNATQSPWPRGPAQINTHKHAHRRRRGPHSPPQVPASGKSPGAPPAPSPRDRCLRPAAPGAAARPRRSHGRRKCPASPTGPEQRRNGRSGPAASAARAGRERPPDTAGVSPFCTFAPSGISFVMEVLPQTCW